MLQHQEAAQEGLLPAAHKVTWSVLFIDQKGKEGGGATGNNSVCTNHCSPSSYSWRIVFVPITAQPLSPVTRLFWTTRRGKCSPFGQVTTVVAKGQCKPLAGAVPWAAEVVPWVQRPVLAWGQSGYLAGSPLLKAARALEQGLTAVI
jgi:hypothetical protein